MSSSSFPKHFATQDLRQIIDATIADTNQAFENRNNDTAIACLHRLYTIISIYEVMMTSRMVDSVKAVISVCMRSPVQGVQQVGDRLWKFLLNLQKLSAEYKAVRRCTKCKHLMPTFEKSALRTQERALKRMQCFDLRRLPLILNDDNFPSGSSTKPSNTNCNAISEQESRSELMSVVKQAEGRVHCLDTPSHIDETNSALDKLHAAVSKSRIILTLDIIDEILNILMNGLRSGSETIQLNCLKTLNVILEIFSFTSHLLSKGIMEILSDVFVQTNNDLRVEVIRAWRRIICSDINNRNHFLSFNKLPLLLDLFGRDVPESTKEDLSLTFLNLCRSHRLSALAPSTVDSLLSAFIEICPTSGNKTVQKNLIGCLSFLQRNNASVTQALIASNCIPKIVALLCNTVDGQCVNIRILELLGGIAGSADENHTQYLINLGLLTRCFGLLKLHPSSQVRTYVCCFLSFITATNKEQLQHVIDEGGLLETLVEMIRHDTFYAKLEAAQAMLHCTIQASKAQLWQIIEAGLIKSLHILLNICDNTLVEIGLEICRNILKFSTPQEDPLSVKFKLEEAGVLDKIQFLQFHGNAKISALSSIIFVQHINGEGAEVCSGVYKSHSDNESEEEFDFPIDSNAETAATPYEF